MLFCGQNLKAYENENQCYDKLDVIFIEREMYRVYDYGYNNYYNDD